MECVKEGGEIVVFFACNSVVSRQCFDVVKFEVLKDVFRDGFVDSFVAEIATSERKQFFFWRLLYDNQVIPDYILVVIKDKM